MKKEIIMGLIFTFVFCVGVIFGYKMVRYINISSNQSQTTNSDNDVLDDKSESDRNETSSVETDETSDSSKTQVEEKANSLSKNDSIVVNEISSLEAQTVTLLNSEKSDSIKDKAKGIFINLVDFVFYGGTIKGITFDELTDAGKEKVLKLIGAIDGKIEKEFPNYKDTISSKTKAAYNKASEIIKEYAGNVSEFSKEKLGEEKYNSIIDAKDEVINYSKKAANVMKDVGLSISNKTSNALKTWYQKFKTK